MFKNKQKLVYASSLSAIASIIFVIVITIWAEESAPLKVWLAGLMGHHWVSKSVLSLAIYIVLLKIFYFIPKEMNGETIKKYLNVLTLTAFLGTGAILLYYTSHFLGWF